MRPQIAAETFTHGTNTGAMRVRGDFHNDVVSGFLGAGVRNNDGFG